MEVMHTKWKVIFQDSNYTSYNSFDHEDERREKLRKIQISENVEVKKIHPLIVRKIENFCNST